MMQIKLSEFSIIFFSDRHILPFADSVNAWVLNLNKLSSPLLFFAKRTILE